MRIEPFQSPPVKPSEASPSSEKPAGSGEPPPVSPGPDSVSLSRLSRILTGEVERDARVEELRVKVAEGSYHVPASDLSRRIVDALLDSEE